MSANKGEVNEFDKENNAHKINSIHYGSDHKEMENMNSIEFKSEGDSSSFYNQVRRISQDHSNSNSNK